jgi:hypothetical protein
MCALVVAEEGGEFSICSSEIMLNEVGWLYVHMECWYIQAGVSRRFQLESAKAKECLLEEQDY